LCEKLDVHGNGAKDSARCSRTDASISIGNAVSMSREGDVPKPRRGYDVWTESEELCPWNLKPYKATVLIVLII
jgi:hypothetical protein